MAEMILDRDGRPLDVGDTAAIHGRVVDLWRNDGYGAMVTLETPPNPEGFSQKITVHANRVVSAEPKPEPPPSEMGPQGR